MYFIMIYCVFVCKIGVSIDCPYVQQVQIAVGQETEDTCGAACKAQM